MARAFPFVWWPNTHFDSDQAVVGLMAKHISEGRAWPLYFYGQNYMLAVEAYLAAPVMWALGATVLALKLPLVLINIASRCCCCWLLVREARLSPWVALIPVLPIALPAAGIAARTTEAMGGNVEPWLYVLLLWWLRDRPFAFGAMLGIGVLHREFTAYGAAALLMMDALGLATHPDRTALAPAIACGTGRSSALLSSPYASRGGRPSAVRQHDWAREPRPTIARCWPRRRARWPAGSASSRTLGHSRAAADRRSPAASGRRQGRAAAGLRRADRRLLGPGRAVACGSGAITLAGLAAGGWHWWRRQNRRRRGADVRTSGDISLLVGTISTLVYGFAACTRIGPETLRYNLLGVWIPVGALVMAVQTWRQPAVRAGFARGGGVVVPPEQPRTSWRSPRSIVTARRRIGDRRWPTRSNPAA